MPLGDSQIDRAPVGAEAQESWTIAACMASSRGPLITWPNKSRVGAHAAASNSYSPALPPD
jgi:hypothetical protein